MSVATLTSQYDILYVLEECTCVKVCYIQHNELCACVFHLLDYEAFWGKSTLRIRFKFIQYSLADMKMNSKHIFWV